MARSIMKMPKVADSVDEVLILKWLVSEGAAVGQGDGVVLVETDKVEVEVPAPVAGVIVEILVSEGNEVATGTGICVFET